jgi:hypothetical protein
MLFVGTCVRLPAVSGFVRHRGLAPSVRVRYLIFHIHLDLAFCRERFPKGFGRVSERALAIRIPAQQQGQRE